MDANAFRHLFDYHFAENRKFWDTGVVTLSQEQFVQPLNYSIGSVRDQVVHLMTVDDIWFSPLRGAAIPDWPDPTQYDDRALIRAQWDTIEQHMRTYLVALTDDKLNEKPYAGEDENLVLWQVLLHVINHGTDHRSQLLRQLNDLGLQTIYQDYIFYIYGHPAS